MTRAGGADHGPHRAGESLLTAERAMKRMSPLGARRVGCVLVFSLTALVPAALAAQGAEDRNRIAGVIVTAPRAPDELLLDHLTDFDIAGYGVDTIGELLAGLTRELAGAQASAPLVLINGRRITSPSEVADLPTESIQRIEVLREHAAVRYGGSPGQKVVNIVLRPQFRSATASLSGGLATEGDWRNGEGAFSLARIQGDNRLSLGAKVYAAGQLLESERDIQPTPTGFDILGNIIPAPGRPGGEIDPALSIAAGRLVTVAGVPAGVERPGLADFASTANLANVSDLGPFRTLSPERRRYSLNGTITRELSEDLTASVNASVNHETSKSRNGLAAATLLLPASSPYSPFSNTVAIARYLDVPLEQSVRGIGGHLGISANAKLGRWSLSTSTELGHRQTRISTDRGVGTDLLQTRLTAGDPSLNPFGPLPASILGPRLRDRARSRLGTGGATFVVSGPLLRAPAGDVRVSLQTDLTRSSLRARLARADLVTKGERERTDAGVWLNIEAPITRRGRPGGAVGDVSTHFSAAIRSVSDVRTLESLGYGLNWTPRSGVSITASMKQDRQPPTLLQLASPIVETSGLRLFDYVSGETVELTGVSGGNPALLPDRRRTLKVGIDILPLKADRLRISAEYARIRVRDPIANLPAATAEIQGAFPERFIRDSNGALLRIDSRLINFAREDRQQLHWGFVFRHAPKRIATAGDSNAAGDARSTASKGNGIGARLGFRLSLHHTWIFKDELLLRPGIPALDRLHGGPTGSAGGQPRHLLQWEVGANSRGLGARLTGNWRSATTVRSGTEDLHFSSLTQHDLHLYADLAEPLPSWARARGVRLSLTIVNLLNDRQKVRDPRGATPLIYQPAYMDPLGRTVTLGLRKQLY
jgi:iron complex outermembrane receptor protein